MAMSEALCLAVWKKLMVVPALGAGATGTVKHWLMSSRSCFTIPETSHFLAETFVAVAQPNWEKGVKYGSLGCRYDVL